MITGIYYIKNIVNGKYYIGQSFDIERRLRVHLRELRNGKHDNVHLQRAFDKYKESNFTCKILECCTINDLNDLECYYISKYDSFENGYNMTEGGDGAPGFHHNTETRKKMSEVQKEVYSLESAREKFNVLFKDGMPLSCKIKQSKTKGNKTGYFRVRKLKRNDTNSGFIWCYRYRKNGKDFALYSVDIKKLEKKVKDRGLEWIKF